MDPKGKRSNMDDGLLKETGPSKHTKQSGFPRSVVGHPVGLKPKTHNPFHIIHVGHEIPYTWTLSIDGTTNLQGSGNGIVMKGPNDLL